MTQTDNEEVPRYRDRESFKNSDYTLPTNFFKPVSPVSGIEIDRKINLIQSQTDKAKIYLNALKYS